MGKFGILLAFICGTYPIVFHSLKFLIFVSSINISPLEGLSSLKINLSKVDFPLPFAPIIAIKSLS